MYACQVQKNNGETLKRYVYDCDKLHDAMNAYCQNFGLDPRDVSESKSELHSAYWIEHQEVHDVGFDFIIY